MKLHTEKPGRAEMTSMPVMVWEPAAAKKLEKTMSLAPTRMKEATKLFLLEFTGIVLEEIRSRAPEITEKEDGTGWKYPAILEVAVVGRDAVAVYAPEMKRAVVAGEKTVIYVKAKRVGPALDVLEKWSPWPAGWIPFKPAARSAQLIARRVSAEEYGKVEARIRKEAKKIEADFVSTGMKGVKVGDRGRDVGAEVVEDLMFSVLRYEYGLGEKMKRHWRPALEEAKGRIPKLKEKMLEYVVTGKNRFDIPEADRVSEGELGDGSFQARIAGI